ncbi:MAG: glycosyltransferase [Syntrophobacteraceae bacterium]
MTISRTRHQHASTSSPSGIVSPMATGNGAFVVHKMIERHIPEYRVEAYHPYWTLLPMMLPLAASIGKPRLIHTTPDHAPFFMRRGVPLIVSFQNYVLDSFMAAYSTLPQRVHYATDLRLFTRLSLRLASRVTAVSQATASLVRQDLRFNGPIDIIYNGVDTRVFSPPSRPRSNATVRVLFSGNLTRRKGATFCRCFAKGFRRRSSSTTRAGCGAVALFMTWRV